MPNTNINPADVESLIRQKKDKEGKTWDVIAKELAQLGYRSPRTNKPLAAASVRYVYFYGDARKAHGNKRKDSEEETPKLEMISNVLRLKGDAGMKLSLIEQIMKD
jgi:hypothetical protein